VLRWVRLMALILASLLLLGGLVAIAGNALVAAILRSERHAWLSDRVLLLSLPARAGRAGRTLAVDYRRDAADPALVRVASDFSWWRALEAPDEPAGVPVTLRIAGRTHTGRARIMGARSEPERRLAGLKQLRPGSWRRASAWGSVLIEIRLDGDGPSRVERRETGGVS
jgi:hypothetical protein